MHFSFAYVSLLTLPFLGHCHSHQFTCNIQKVNVQTIEDTGNIINEFPQQPAIFVGARDRNHLLSQAASEETLRALHGDSVVTLASSNTYSHDTVDMTLSEYLDMIHIDTNHSESHSKANETYYLFGNNFSDLFKRLEEHYVLPPCTDCREAGATTLGIGGSQSGVSFHFHGPGFAEVITGRKLFLLYPPDMDKEVQVPVSPNLTMSQWVDEIYPTLVRKQVVNPAFQTHATGSSVVQDNGDVPTPVSASAQGDSGKDDEGNIYAILEQPSTSGIASSVGEEALLEKCDDHDGDAIDDLSTSTSNSVHVSPTPLLESLYECVLEPGEMLYFPDKWMHATLNLDSYNLFVSVFLDLQLIQRATDRRSKSKQ